MEYDENFNVRCDINEAIRLSKYLTLDIDIIASDCYTNAFYNAKGEIFRKQHRALDAVYMLGFISGSRAIRKRLKAKGQA